MFVHLYVYNLQDPTRLSRFTQLTPNKMEAVGILGVIETWGDLESIILRRQIPRDITYMWNL